MILLTIALLLIAINDYTFKAGVLILLLAILRQVAGED